MNTFGVDLKELKTGDTLQFVFAEAIEDGKVYSESAYRDFADFADSASKINTYKVKHHLCRVIQIREIKPPFDLFERGSFYSVLLEDTSSKEYFLLNGDENERKQSIVRADETKLSLFEI